MKNETETRKMYDDLSALHKRLHAMETSKMIRLPLSDLLDLMSLVEKICGRLRNFAPVLAWQLGEHDSDPPEDADGKVGLDEWVKHASEKVAEFEEKLAKV